MTANDCQKETFLFLVCVTFSPVVLYNCLCTETYRLLLLDVPKWHRSKDSTASQSTPFHKVSRKVHASSDSTCSRLGFLSNFRNLQKACKAINNHCATLVTESIPFHLKQKKTNKGAYQRRSRALEQASPTKIVKDRSRDLEVVYFEFG